MNVHMKLSEILMDELPQEHPWKGNVRGLVERLIANGVTFAKDTNVLTNADRIREMTDEELASFLACAKFPFPECEKMYTTIRTGELAWLKQPVEE